MPTMGRRKGASIAMAVVLMLTSLAVGVGVVQAAIDGNFTAEFDGYDQQSTSDRGHEIRVTGTIVVRGSNAVEPVISIQSADNTVLDTTTVEIFVEGSRSINFERRDKPGEVEYRTDEIPAGTELEVRFLVYPTGGTQERELDVARVRVAYSTPSGVSQSKGFPITAVVEDSADRVIAELRENTGSGGPGIPMLVLSGFGGISVVFLIGYLAYRAKFKGPQPPGV